MKFHIFILLLVAIALSESAVISGDVIFPIKSNIPGQPPFSDDNPFFPINHLPPNRPVIDLSGKPLIFSNCYQRYRKSLEIDGKATFDVNDQNRKILKNIEDQLEGLK